MAGWYARWSGSAKLPRPRLIAVARSRRQFCQPPRPHLSHRDGDRSTRRLTHAPPPTPPPIPSPTPPSGADRRHPAGLHSATSDSIVIVWETDRPLAGEVIFGREGAYDRRILSPGDGLRHGRRRSNREPRPL
jgi:hypothetical protein